MGFDVDKPGVDIRDPMRIAGSLGLSQQGIALDIRLEHDFDQAFRSVRGLFGKAAGLVQRGGIVIIPVSVGNSPRIALNRVDLPTPLRPTKPTRAPGTIWAEPWSIRSRPAIRTDIPVIESMRACHRSSG